MCKCMKKHSFLVLFSTILSAAISLVGTVHAGIQNSNASDKEIQHGNAAEVSVHETNPYFEAGPLTGSRNAGNPHGGGGSNGISYRGGPVMLGTVNVYFIWYGNWSGNTAT